METINLKFKKGNANNLTKEKGSIIIDSDNKKIYLDTSTSERILVGTTDYNDLSNKAAINNGTLTIQKNGTNVTTFTANQSGNATANITVPTKVSELTNDSGFKTTDNNTTYTFATGDSNGQIKVTPSGGSAQNVSVKGLGSAAYTASTAYRASSWLPSKSDIGLGNVDNTADANKSVNYANSAGWASKAGLLYGEYTGSGGQQGPSYIGINTVRCNMMSAFRGTDVTSFGSYADVLMMNAYNWSDVPYATALAIKKGNSNPRAWIACGGNSENWSVATELLTAHNYKTYCTTGNIGAMAANPSQIELNNGGSATSHGGYIDFHFGGTTTDYTSRIIENVSGSLSVNGLAISGGAISLLKVGSQSYGSSVPSSGTAGRVYFKTTGASTAWKKVSVTTSAGEADITCSGVTTSSAVIATRNCTGAGGNYAQLLGGCYSNGKVHVGNIPGSTLGANTYNVTVWWSK